MPVEQLVYTDVPRGKGFDPTLAGFQVASCSPGLDAAARDLLGAVCRHYGDAVYRGASDEALDRESAWRASADSVAAMPDDVRALFPEVWSYDALGDGRYAITRVRYAGATHDGRFGNFLAHAIVFAPDEVAPAWSSPLALARAELGLVRVPAGPALVDAPYRDRLEELLAAAGRASSLERPLLVRVADWRDGVGLVEALVDALPPSRRWRTTFSTLENDRKWLLPSGPASRQAGAVAAHDVVVLAGRAGGDLRPDEYRSGYRVFNFVDARFGDSEPGAAAPGAAAPGAYALFAGRCLRSGDADALERSHAALARLGLDGDVRAWDALVGVEHLPDEGEPAPFAHALAASSSSPESARAALDLLAATLRAKAGRGEELTAVVESAAPDLARLAERAGDGGSWPDLLRDLAREAIERGRGRLAGELFRAFGPRRDAALLAVLPSCAETVRALPRGPEADRLSALLFESADAARAAGDDATLELSIETALAIAPGDAWETSAASRLEAYLGGAWDERRAAFASRLASVLAPETFPEGAAWLGERVVAATGPRGRELVDTLSRIARASSGCAAETRLAESVLKTARASFAGAGRCEALGRIASAAPSDLFFDAYAAEVRALGAGERFALRRSLSESGAAAAPVRELLGEALPWDREAFERWWEELARESPGARAELSRQLAARLAETGEPGDGALDFALAVLDRTRSDASRVPLLDAVALAVPIGPLSDALDDLFGSGDGLGEAATRRLATMRLLAEVEALSADARWSAGTFLTRFGADEWPQTIRALRREDKEAALSFCRATFEAQGIQTPEDAEGWVLFMGAAGEATVEEITASVIRMLDGRDQVTCVVAAAAFAQCALGATRIEGAWTEILRDLVGAFDKETRRAFERHILLRFNRPDRDYNLRIEALARETGFTPPSEMGAPARSGVALKPPVQKAASTTSLFGSSKRFFGKK